MLNKIGAVVTEARALVQTKCVNYSHCINCADTCEFYALCNALYNFDVEKHLRPHDKYEGKSQHEAAGWKPK